MIIQEQAKALKIGVLGGTFDPIHRGHIYVADVVKERLGLDRIYLVTAKSPPHKSHYLASAELRHAMVEAACRDSEDGVDRSYLVPSRLELDREGKSYTVDTFRKLKEEMQAEVEDGVQTQLYLITSAEYLAPEQPTWIKNWDGAEELFKLCTIVVTPRRHMSATMAQDWAKQIPDADVIVVDLESPPISSLMVKRALKKGNSISELVPPAVEDFIQHSGLYTTSESTELAELDKLSIQPDASASPDKETAPK